MKIQMKMVLLAGLMLFISQSTGLSMTVEDLDRKVKNNETVFYREFFDGIFFKPLTKFLRFDQLKNRLKTTPALDVNVFDEVPDSVFFTNRHGKNKMSIAELVRGPAGDTRLDSSGPWRVTKGKMEGVSVGLFIEDAKGDRYLLKFDPKDYPEMMTSAEIISHKFFYALGYFVPQYDLVEFKPEILQIDPNATYYNEDGFKKPLTQDALENFIEKIPKFKGGIIRASASKLLRKAQGPMSFEGRRKDDPEDLIPHQDRRPIRALRVFGSWLNHYDLREGNTLDVIEETKEGDAFIKHYLIDFGSTLGSAGNRPKVPAAGFEHIVDWYEAGKTVPTLKIVEKPWEKKWDALKRQVASSAIGYFDNSQFDPGEWKTQLPFEVFKLLTASDAFWAAKIIMSFTAEEIEKIVDSADFSDPEDTKTMAGLLIVRRNMIGQYWFSKVTPLDQIKISHLGSGNYRLEFKDLNVQHRFATKEETAYRVEQENLNPASDKISIPPQEFTEPSLSFSIPAGVTKVTLRLQARYGTRQWSSPPLRVALAQNAENPEFSIVEIDHGI